MGGQRVEASFVSRIWLERGPDGEPRWRGHIQHVQSGRQGYFLDLDEMRAFLERISGVTGPGGERGPEGAVAQPPSAASGARTEEPGSPAAVSVAKDATRRKQTR